MNTSVKQVEIIAPKVEKREYELPPAGLIGATLIQILDEGKTTRFGDEPKHTIVFIWETDAMDSHGARIRVFDRMTVTLSHKGRLASRIEALTGTLPHEDESYLVHTLVGSRAMLMIKHVKTPKGTFANVVGVFPAGEVKAGQVKAKDGKPQPAADGKAPSPAPTTAKATAKAGVPCTPANSKPTVSAPSSQADCSELPPEPHDDAGDDGTSFPGDNATSDENAA